MLTFDGERGSEMARNASYPARELKRRRNEWMRRNVRVVASVVVGIVVLGVGGGFALLSVPMPFRFWTGDALSPAEWDGNRFGHMRVSENLVTTLVLRQSVAGG